MATGGKYSVATSTPEGSPPVETDQDRVGFLTKGVAEPLAIVITDENRHLFFYDREQERYQLPYHGSAIVVDMLALDLDNQQANPYPYFVNYPLVHHMAFFDTAGGFHNFARLRGLHLDRQSGDGVEKHTASFDVFDQSAQCYTPLVIAVDDIYCLSGAAHPYIDPRNGID